MKLRFWLPSEAREGVALLDNNGQLKEINGALFKLYGYGCKEDMLSVNAINHIAKGDRLRVLKVVAEQLEQGCDSPVRCKLLRKNRSEMTAELFVSRARNSEGKSIGFVVSIKERKWGI